MQQPRAGCIIMNQSVHYSLFQNQLVRYCQLLLPGAVKPRGGRSPFCFRLSHSLPSCLFTCHSRRKCFPGTWEVCFSTMGEHHGPHMVRTTRNSAFPLIMRAYPWAAFAIGYFSIMGRTPIISANRRVSCESVGMPPAQPLIPFLPKSN